VTVSTLARSAAPNIGLDLVGLRAVVVPAPVTWFPLRPGDRALVGTGETVMVGTPLAELLHEQRLVDVPAPAVGIGARSGARWEGLPRRGFIGRRRADVIAGELLFEVGGRWRIATGDVGGLLESPAAGIVREVRAGIGIALQVAGSAIDGVRAIGAPARGRLDVAVGSDADVRATGLDVGRAGAIMVVGGRVDAATLTRARAMGIRGMVVGSLTAKELRDFGASEARQRASLHRLPPFAVLVLDGAIRRGVASPVRAALAALAGHDVAITADPPQLLFDPTGVRVPPVPPGLLRVRQGAWGGREGQWAGPAGLRRFRGGVRLEAGFVRFDDGPPVVLPLADLERFA
jgi:hypothetical protein